MKPNCPRCNSTELRAKKEKSLITCRHCGYKAHWRQFFPGTKERKEVEKLFKKGELEGKEVIAVKQNK